MTQIGLFDKPQYPPNPFKPESQNFRLYERLKYGPITNGTIVKDLHILKYTGRLSDVREALRPHLLDVSGRPLGGGLWEYRIAGGLS